MVNEGTNDRDFTVGTSGNNLTTKENTVIVKPLESCFNERIDKAMSNIVDTVEDRIQNAILTAIDSIVAPRFEIAVRSLNASSGRDAAHVTANSDCGEHIGFTDPSEAESENNNVLQISNVKDETQNNFPNEVSKLSVPETRFDRQPHTHHSCSLSV